MPESSVQRPELSIVIPVYSEESHLKQSLLTIRDALDSLDKSYELVIIDDGSIDNTWDIVVESSEMFPIFRAVRLSRNFGKERALSAGIEKARGDAVIIMDSDLQHPPQLIAKMVHLWRETGADIVEGIKADRGKESFINRFQAKFFYFIFNKLSGFNLYGSSDFKLLDRRVVDAWLKLTERSLFFRGLIAWLGFKHVQMPFRVADRAEGPSRWSTLRLLNLSIDALISFSSSLLRIIIVIGGIFLLFALVLGVQTFSYWAMGRAVSGFATVIILLLIIGSFIMISLGIIGEYIAKIYEEVKERPRYVVAETLDKN